MRATRFIVSVEAVALLGTSAAPSATASNMRQRTFPLNSPTSASPEPGKDGPLTLKTLISCIVSARYPDNFELSVKVSVTWLDRPAPEHGPLR